jgi:hypothetical protein
VRLINRSISTLEEALHTTTWKKRGRQEATRERDQEEMASAEMCPNCMIGLKPQRLNFTEVMLKCSTVRTLPTLPKPQRVSCVGK